MNHAPIPRVDELEDDDRLIGRILSRREVLALFGTGGVALTIAACAPAGSSGTSAGASASSGVATASATPASSAAATASASASAAAAVPSCVVIPELTEGPYFL